MFDLDYILPSANLEIIHVLHWSDFITSCSHSPLELDSVASGMLVSSLRDRQRALSRSSHSVLTAILAETTITLSLSVLYCLYRNPCWDPNAGLPSDLQSSTSGSGVGWFVEWSHGLIFLPPCAASVGLFCSICSSDKIVKIISRFNSWKNPAGIATGNEYDVSYWMNQWHSQYEIKIYCMGIYD